MKDKRMWAYLLHLGYNMWNDVEWHSEYTKASDTMRCDLAFWDEFVPFMAASGINTCVIDLGEGVRYDSHPELAVEGSWSKEFLRKKLNAMRNAGITPIPKLNFSAGHDQWMGDYAHALSSRWYYEFCRDIIAEVIELFDKPEFFHIGMDEETYGHQQHYSYAVVRQNDLWWHDFYYLVDQVEKSGSRAWIWSDYIWDKTDVFLKKMPKTVLQSNWYYGRLVPEEQEHIHIKSYNLLEQHGFEQVPTGSNWSCSENFERTVEYCKKIIAPERLRGFMQAPWKPSLTDRKYRHMEAADLVRQAIWNHYGNL